MRLCRRSATISRIKFRTIRCFERMDEDSVHDLATRLVQAAADSEECVIVGHGAQCLLQGRADVFK